MKTFSAIIALMLFTLMSAWHSSLLAQPLTFVKMYNKGNCGYAVREVNGNYISAGGTDFYYNYHWHTMSSFVTSNIHLIRTDSIGNLLWEKIYNSSNSRTIAVWMEPSVDGGFILTGHNNKDNVWPPDSNDVVLVKTNANGVIEWAKTFDTGHDELGYCVRQTTDGGYIVSGFHDAFPVSLAGNTYTLLIKTDTNGSVLWEKKYQIAVRDFDTGEAFPSVVRQTADGGFIIVGTTMGSHQADVYLIRTDSAGNVLWAKSYEHDNSAFRLSVGLDVLESASGDFIVAGSMDKDRSLQQFNYPYILKVSSTGGLISAKLYDSNPAQMFQSGFSSVQPTFDGGYFFTGMGGYGGFGDQAQLLKTDAGLNMQWSRVYSWDGVATVGSRSGRETTDGGFIFTGKRQFTGTILMKTNSAGFIPCKNPGTLIEISPSVIVQARNPSVVSGINANNFSLSTQSALVDTVTTCAVATTTMPIELLSFSARPLGSQKVLLSWSTASETNNDHFVTERSADGKNFYDAGTVKGAGTSSGILNYSFTDENPVLSGVSYYRLTQVDYDGASSASQIVPVSLDKNDMEIINVFADPNRQTIEIYFYDSKIEYMEYSISDILGNIITRVIQNSSAGINHIVLDAKNLSRGAYFFSMSGKKNILTKNFFY